MENKDEEQQLAAAETQAETPVREGAAAAVKNYFRTLPKRYFITAFSGMAQGLFVTLIAGTILAQIAGWLGDNAFAKMVMTLANVAKSLMGVGIGVGIAHALGKNKLIVFSATVAGFIGAFANTVMDGTFALALGAPGNPIGSYVSQSLRRL